MGEGNEGTEVSCISNPQKKRDSLKMIRFPSQKKKRKKDDWIG